MDLDMDLDMDLNMDLNMDLDLDKTFQEWNNMELEYTKYKIDQKTTEMYQKMYGGSIADVAEPTL